MGGWLNTSCIVVSIRAIASVRYREVVRSWEGPLWEVPLYTRTCVGIASPTVGRGDQSIQQEEGCRAGPASPVREGGHVQEEEVASCV